MFGIGMGEMALLLLVALIVLGPERMPKLARDLGRAVAEFRRTSDELRGEFLNADKYLGAPATPAEPTLTPEAPAPSSAMAPAAPTGDETGGPATVAATDHTAPLEPDETAFDREAREARERLRDPARMEQAKTEGWTAPSDEAGTSERWG